MRFLYHYLFIVMWVTFVLYWRFMAANVKADERVEASNARRLRLILMLVALVLLGIPAIHLSVLDRRFLPQSYWWFWIGAVVTALGLLFSVWARRYLGQNWSQAVSIKKDHELITGGPYSLVRHPIYTGLLTGLLGCAIALGEWRGLLAVALVFVALLRKLRLEEQWMRSQFGETYESYARRTRALVPFVV